VDNANDDLTPLNLLSRTILEGNLKGAIVIGLYENGDIAAGWSDGMTWLQILGLLEAGKQDIIDSMYTEEDNDDNEDVD